MNELRYNRSAGPAWHARAAQTPEPPSIVNLQQRWIDLCRRLGPSDAGSADTIFLCVEALYAYPPRDYHNLAHIGACLALLDKHLALASDPDAIEAAIFLHDCVYVAGRGDNEQRSAMIAGMFLGYVGVAAARIARIGELILVTRHTDVPPDADCALIQDIDLAGLGASPADFDRDGAAIRREFSAYSDDEFRRGRREFLRAMLSRPQIYFTPPFQQAYEARARQNLTRALHALGA